VTGELLRVVAARQAIIPEAVAGVAQLVDDDLGVAHDGQPGESPGVVGLAAPGSYGSRMRDELLAIEQFDTLLEAQVLIADWRTEYNTYRPHSALGMLTPVDYADQWRRPTHPSSHSGWTDQRGPVTRAVDPPGLSAANVHVSGNARR
jgi:hypothetical protein